MCCPPTLSSDNVRIMVRLSCVESVCLQILHLYCSLFLLGRKKVVFFFPLLFLSILMLVYTIFNECSWDGTPLRPHRECWIMSWRLVLSMLACTTVSKCIPLNRLLLFSVCFETSCWFILKNIYPIWINFYFNKKAW